MFEIHHFNGIVMKFSVELKGIIDAIFDLVVVNVDFYDWMPQSS
jgi:hypothetical protein